MNKTVTSRKNPLRSVFLLAAEKQLLRPLQSSMFACNNLSYAYRELILHNSGWSFEPTAEHKMFRKYFLTEGRSGPGGAWWGDSDQEARILALLLCAEMLRR